MLLIDFEKAFDTVAWSFIEKCLVFYNFKPDIIKWIKVFYTNIKSTIIVNNEPTSWFAIERGCRQGDPASPYIFLLCGEILAHMIRQNNGVKGYMINDKEIRISQYADDTTLFLDGTQESFKNCVHLVLEYAKYSGLAMNFEKTKVVWFGCPNPPNEIYLPHLNFEWNPPKFSILGVEFTTSIENITNVNIEKKLGPMQQEINNWTRRDITPFGKIVVIKTLIVSKIVHILISLPSPSETLVKKINKMLYDFLWDNKPDKVKRKIIIKKLEQGGLAMLDLGIFDKSLKLTWIRRFLKCETKWKDLISSIYPDIHNAWQYGNNYVLKMSKTFENLFWENVLNYYYEFHNKVKVNSIEDIYETSFMYNDSIKIGRKVIANQELMRNGVFLIKHLLQDDNFLNYDSFILKYNVNIDYLTFYSIVQSIKKVFKLEEYEKTNIKLKYQPPLETIMKKKSGASDIYKVFLSFTVQYTGFNKWHQLTDISHDEWLSSFACLKFTTKDTKLRWLQYRILHHILTTNRSVAKYDESQDHLCTFCHKYSETILHLFWSCEKVSSFFDSLSTLINRRCQHVHNFHFDRDLVLFGQSQSIYTDNICNLMIMMAKFFIYRNKVNKSPLNLNAFITEFYQRYSAEKNYL